MKKLNLGCGKVIKEGYINLDIVPMEGVNVIHNIENTPLPFKNNTFDEVYASHILEHVKNFMPLMEDLHRVCKKDAVIKIKAPYFASTSAFSDPTHVRFLTLKTFNCFDPDNYNNFITKARFKTTSRKLLLTRKNWWVNKPAEFIVNRFQWIYERCFCFIFPFQEIHYELQVVK